MLASPWKRSRLSMPLWNGRWNWPGSKKLFCRPAALHLPGKSVPSGEKGLVKYKSFVVLRWTYPKTMVALAYPQPR